MNRYINMCGLGEAFRECIMIDGLWIVGLASYQAFVFWFQPSSRGLEFAREEFEQGMLIYFVPCCRLFLFGCRLPNSFVLLWFLSTSFGAQ